MAHQSNDRGTLRIDKRYRGIGRLAKATGTRDPKMLALYAGMCDALYASGRTDWLQALMHGVLSFSEAWTLYRPVSGRTLDVTRLPSPETVRRLWLLDEDGVTERGAVAAWIAGRDVAAATRAIDARDLGKLRQIAKPTATVADVPELLRRVREQTLKATPQPRRAFNMLRTTVLAFLRDTVGQRHALYFAVSDLKPLDAPRKPTSGLTAAEARGVCAALAAHGDPAHGRANAAAFWALCTTGMRPAEYWQEGTAHWTLGVDRVTVVASKTGGGVTPRDLPVVDRAVLLPGPQAVRNSIESALSRLSRGDSPFKAPWPRRVSLYTGRRTFVHACELAGIPESRAMAYRSMEPRTVHQRYAQHTITPEYLAEDGAKLRAWFGVTDDGAGLRLVGPRVVAGGAA